MNKINKRTRSQYVWEKFFPNLDLLFLFAALNENIVHFHNNTTLPNRMVFCVCLLCQEERTCPLLSASLLCLVEFHNLLLLSLHCSKFRYFSMVEKFVFHKHSRFCKLSLCIVLNLTLYGKNSWLQLVYSTYFLTNNFIKPLFCRTVLVNATHTELHKDVRRNFFLSNKQP